MKTRELFVASFYSGASLASPSGFGFGAVLKYCPLQPSPLAPKICTTLNGRQTIRISMRNRRWERGGAVGVVVDDPRGAAAQAAVALDGAQQLDVGE